MSELAKVKQQFAKEVLQHFELEEGSEAVVLPNASPLACIQALVEHKQFNDAVKMIAHVLPKREAVWWACLAARNASQQIAALDPGASDAGASAEANKSALENAAITAAETWVKEPSEENRQKAKLLGEKTGHKSAGSWAATAAFWSAGSMTPEGEPVVPPPPYLYAHAVAGCVTLAAVLPNPENREANFHRYIKQGLDLANGGRGDVAA